MSWGSSSEHTHARTHTRTVGGGKRETGRAETRKGRAAAARRLREPARLTRTQDEEVGARAVARHPFGHEGLPCIHVDVRVAELRPRAARLGGGGLASVVVHELAVLVLGSIRLMVNRLAVAHAPQGVRVAGTVTLVLLPRGRHNKPQ